VTAAVGGAAKKSTGAKSVIAATAGSSDRKPALPTAAKAASAAAARSRADDQVNEEVYNDPKVPYAVDCDSWGVMVEFVGSCLSV